MKKSHLAILLLSVAVLLAGFSSAAETNKIYRVGLKLGYNNFTFSESHPDQPSASVAHFNQRSLEVNASFRLWIAPGRLDFLTDFDDTIHMMQVNDHKPAISLYRYSGGLNTYFAGYGDFHGGLGAGLSLLSMSTPGRSFGYKNLKGVYIQPEFTYDLISAPVSLTISLLPRLTLLNSDSPALGYTNREWSYQVQFRGAAGSGKYPRFSTNRTLTLTVAVDELHFNFLGVRPVPVDSLALRALIGFEF